MNLTVEYDRSGGARVEVSLFGEADLSVEKQLSAVLHAALVGPPPAAAVVVDLSGLRFLACAGVRVLLQAKQAAQAQGCVLTVRDPQPVVERILRILRVADCLGLGPKSPACSEW